MEENLYQQRKDEASRARRKVQTTYVHQPSFFEKMDEKEREEFFAREKKRSERALRARFIRNRISIGFGFLIALAASVLAIVPVFYTFINSFMSSAEISGNYGVIFQSLSGHVQQGATYLASTPTLTMVPQRVTFEQYANLLFMSPTYLIKFWNSIILVVPIVVGQMIASCLAAYSFARYRKKRREVLFFSYIILMLMPFQVTLVPNYMIADQLGILNTRWAIILPGIFSTFAIYLLTKYTRQIPIAYIEAAKLDGATEWQIFTRIAVPMCKNAIFALSILLFIDYWNMVEQPLVLLTDVSKQPMSVFLSQINEAEIGIAFAASALYMIPPLLIFLWGEDYLVEGISRAGVK